MFTIWHSQSTGKNIPELNFLRINGIECEAVKSDIPNHTGIAVSSHISKAARLLETNFGRGRYN